jgi:hypothetical protein
LSRSQFFQQPPANVVFVNAGGSQGVDKIGKRQAEYKVAVPVPVVGIEFEPDDVRLWIDSNERTA